jgi:hypothetical protein
LKAELCFVTPLLLGRGPVSFILAFSVGPIANKNQVFQVFSSYSFMWSSFNKEDLKFSLPLFHLLFSLPPSLSLFLLSGLPRMEDTQTMLEKSNVVQALAHYC